MRTLILGLVVLFGSGVASPGQAQQAPSAALVPAGVADTVKLTLAAALAEARPASEQVGIAQAEVSRSEGVVTQTRSALLPQVNLGPQYTRVLESPYENLFSGGGANIENPFTSTNQWRLGGSVGISLFNLSQWSQLSASQAATRVSRLQLTQQQALTILSVASAYYDASLSAQLLTITEFTLAQAEKTLADVTLGREVGTQSEFEELRARVSRDNQIPVVTRARANRDIAITRLKQLLDIPLSSELVLATPLDESPDIGYLPEDVAEMIRSADTTVAARAVVRAAEETVAQSEHLSAAASRQWIPTMSTTMNYNRAGFSSAFFPVNSQFGNDWTINAVLNWPLFTSGRISGARRQAASTLDAARLRAKLTEEQAALDNETVNARLREARDNSLATASVVEQATRAYEIAELRYAEGVSTQTELQDVRLQLEQARANQAQAARDMQVARFRRALLPYLPLGTADGAALMTSSVTSAGSATQALAGTASARGR